MVKKTHILGGVSMGIVAYKANNVLDIYSSDLTGFILFLPIVTYISGLILGSLLPDIDTPQSFLGRIFKFVSIPINKIFGHRTITHSIFFAIFSAGIVILPSMSIQNPLIDSMLTSFGVGILIGDISHILLDSLTVSGVPFLYPILKSKFSLTKMKTGGAGEQFISVLLILSILASTYSLI